jgi:hypothetical protein
MSDLSEVSYWSNDNGNRLKSYVWVHHDSITISKIV